MKIVGDVAELGTNRWAWMAALAVVRTFFAQSPFHSCWEVTAPQHGNFQIQEEQNT